MIITKKSMFSGEWNTMDIPVTQSQIDDWESGTLIQDAMPNISPEEREFIMSGTMPESWKKHIKKKKPILNKSSFQKSFSNHLEALFMARNTISDTVKDILNEKKD